MILSRPHSEKCPHLLQEIPGSLWLCQCGAGRGDLEKNFVGVDLAPMVVPYFLSTSQEQL